jgi:hypothetical protein
MKATDEHGRLIPRTEEEVKARAPEIIRGLDALLDMGPEEEQRETFEALRAAMPHRFRPEDDSDLADARERLAKAAVVAAPSTSEPLRG